MNTEFLPFLCLEENIYLQTWKIIIFPASLPSEAQEWPVESSHSYSSFICDLPCLFPNLQKLLEFYFKPQKFHDVSRCGFFFFLRALSGSLQAGDLCPLVLGNILLLLGL